MYLKTREIPLEARSEDVNSPCEKDPFFRASSTLLSRLGEAVDGHRVGEPVCYLGRYWYDANDQGHRLIGPFRTCEEAETFRRASGLRERDYGIFGPFYTKGAAPESMSPAREVKEVIVRFDDGEEILLDGKKHDALFWTSSAVEKFVLPYYMAIGSLDECNVLIERAAGADALVHRPGSTWESARQVATDDNALAGEASADLGIGLYGLRLDQDSRIKLKAKLVSGGADG